MEVILGVLVTGVLVPLAVWFGDESAGRARWRHVDRRVETISLGDSAFRGGSVAVEHAALTRERAPWWVRGLALTCYLPIGAAIVCALPWLLGVMMALKPMHHNDLEQMANGFLVCVYPFGVWAAARLWSVGRALLSGSASTFRDALARASWVEVPLNVIILVGAAVIAASSRRVEALWLAVTPLAQLAQLAGVAVAGARTLYDEDDVVAAQEDVTQAAEGSVTAA